MSLTLERLDPRTPRVETIWRALEAEAQPSAFLSWSWIETWLACLPRDEAPDLFVLRDDGAAVAACFLGGRRVLRHHLWPSRARFLNTTGVPRLDELCLEHNGMLTGRASRHALVELVARLPGGWDELHLPALDDTPEIAADLDALRARCAVRIDAVVDAPFVDLAKVRAAGDYLSVLGASTRAQIRRARRELGPLSVEIAGDVSHAHDILDELIALHQRHWRERGQPGAFADPWFVRFHRRLLSRGVDASGVQLIRVRAGDATVGCLYSLVGHGRVLFYQSGLAPAATSHCKPGYVCHAEAVRHSAAAGHAVYDLLGGDHDYKQHLSTGVARLQWVRVQRPRLRFAIEEQLRRWRARAQSS